MKNKKDHRLLEVMVLKIFSQVESSKLPTPVLTVQVQ